MTTVSSYLYGSISFDHTNLSVLHNLCACSNNLCACPVIVWVVICVNLLERSWLMREHICYLLHTIHEYGKFMTKSPGSFVPDHLTSISSDCKCGLRCYLLVPGLSCFLASFSDNDDTSPFLQDRLHLAHGLRALNRLRKCWKLTSMI
jgi:hypothetical protein